ncbi:MAG: hypothetical protein RIE59_25855 [Imperialibacter sp.]
MNKRLALLIGFAVATILTFGGLLYYALRTTVTDVSLLAPYTQITDKSVVLQRQAVVAKNLDAFANENPYLLAETGTTLFDGMEIVDTLEAGTTLQIYAAKHFKNGTSGFTHAFVLGSVKLPGTGEAVLFEYAWGEQHISLYGEEGEYWTYPIALWQKNANAGKFYMKKTGLQ